MIKFFFNKLNSKINSVTQAAFVIALASLTSRFLGIFRDRILAGKFGAGDELDIYWAAFRLPDLTYSLIVLGALSAGFIPIFIKQLEKDKIKDYHKAYDFANNILNILVITLLGVNFLFFIFTPIIIPLIAPGFSGKKLHLTIQMTRIMLISPILLSISAILGGILQSFKKFFIYSLCPIMYNLGIIIGALYFVDWWGIYGLAIGVVLGAASHMLIQVYPVKNLGFKYKFLFSLKDENTRRLAKMMLPRTLTLAIAQINFTVLTIIASTLSVGSIAVFNFANNIQSFPLGIFGISFAVAAFPTMSEWINNKEKFSYVVNETFLKILFFIIPSIFLLIILRAQVVRVILGTGKFGWQDTILTFKTLGFFAISLFAQSLIPLLSRVFYAYQDSKTPFFIGLISSIFNLIFALKLSKIMGIPGLALAFSLASIINFTLLLAIVKIKLPSPKHLKILSSVFKISLASLIAGIATQCTKFFIGQFVNMEKLWGVFTQGMIAGLIGIIIYLVVCWLVKSPELISLWNSLKNKLQIKNIKTGDIDQLM